MNSATGQKKFVSLRGLSEVDVSRNNDGTDNLTAQLEKGINKYFNAISNAGLYIRTQVRPMVGGNLWYNVSSVAPETNGYGSFLTCSPLPAFPITPDTQIVFQGIPRDDMPGFPKQCPVNYIAPGPPTGVGIPYRLRITAGTTSYQPAKLKFCILQYAYWTIDAGRFIRFSEHKTGRPTGVPRGRAKSAVTRL